MTIKCWLSTAGDTGIAKLHSVLAREELEVCSWQIKNIENKKYISFEYNVHFPLNWGEKTKVVQL